MANHNIPPHAVIVAWDIETAPLPLDQLTDAQRARMEKEVATLMQRQPDIEEEEARRLVRSTHPFLGFICCISAVAGTLGEGHRVPVSFCASSVDEEKALLEKFWAVVARFKCRPIWVTFNGKRFDVPWLLARSARHGIAPTRSDLTDTYPYKSVPHADLFGAFPYAYALEDMCIHLNIPSSKNGFDGSMVEGAVAEGRLEEVASYCEADVIATWMCYNHLHRYLN